MRCGMVKDDATQVFLPMLINGRQILKFFLAMDMLTKRNGRFLGMEKAKPVLASATRPQVLEAYQAMTKGRGHFDEAHDVDDEDTDYEAWLEDAYYEEMHEYERGLTDRLEQDDLRAAEYGDSVFLF